MGRTHLEVRCFDGGDREVATVTFAPSLAVLNGDGEVEAVALDLEACAVRRERRVGRGIGLVEACRLPECHGRALGAPVEENFGRVKHLNAVVQLLEVCDQVLHVRIVRGVSARARANAVVVRWVFGVVLLVRSTPVAAKEGLALLVVHLELGCLGANEDEAVVFCHLCMYCNTCMQMQQNVRGYNVQEARKTSVWETKVDRTISPNSPSCQVNGHYHASFIHQASHSRSAKCLLGGRAGSRSSRHHRLRRGKIS